MRMMQEQYGHNNTFLQICLIQKKHIFFFDHRIDLEEAERDIYIRGEITPKSPQNPDRTGTYCHLGPPYP